MTHRKTLLTLRASLLKTPRHSGAVLAAATLCLASSVLSSGSALANEVISSDADALNAKSRVLVTETPVLVGSVARPTKVAFYLRTDPSSLHHVIPDRLGSHRLETLAEEASKQAQARYLAEKWGKPKKAVLKYVNLAWEEASKRDLRPELLIAIMQKESSLSPKVQSPYGAQGLMQVVPRWHREKLQPSESLFDPEVNVRVGADVLLEYLKSAGGSLNKALAKYSGNARGYAASVLKESRKLARLADEAAARATGTRAAESLNAG